MKDNFFVTLMILLINAPAISQVQGSESLKVYQIVFQDLENGYLKKFKGRPHTIVINPRTANSDVLETDYIYLANAYDSGWTYTCFDTNLIDRSWIETFRKANSEKNFLGSYEIPSRQIDSVQFMLEPPKQPFSPSLSLSAVFFLGRRAIVGFEFSAGLGDGFGELYFMEKRNGKWTIVTKFGTRIE